MEYEYRLIDLKDYLYGLGFKEEVFPSLLRLPVRYVKDLVKPVKNLNTHTAGVRLRFKTRAKHIEFIAKTGREKQMEHFSQHGQTGFDIFINGQFYTVISGRGKVKWKIDLSSGADKTIYMKEEENLFEIWFPLYNSVKDFILRTDKSITPAPSYRHSLPLVFYGSSITQGGCASRSSQSYEALISSHLNLDIINLGFSGKGMGYPEKAYALSEINALAYILDWGINLLNEKDALGLLKRRYEKFIRIIREKRPHTPIILINIQGIRLDFHLSHKELLKNFRDHIFGVYNKLKEEGDSHLYYIDGRDIISPSQLDATVDGSHPNDYGFKLYAKEIEKMLIKILSLS